MSDPAVPETTAADEGECSCGLWLCAVCRPAEPAAGGKIAASLDAAKRTRWPYVDAPKPTRRPPPAPACAEPTRPLAPNDHAPPARRARRTIETASPLELSACRFVAALAQNVDANRGIVTSSGTPETRAKVAASVKESFFK